MLLNVHNQLCGLFITALLIYLNTRHRIVGLWREFIFRQIMVVTFALCCVDILSVYAIHYMGTVFSEPLTYFICRLNVAIAVSEVSYGVIYLVSKLLSHKSFYKFSGLMFSLNIIAWVLIFVLPIYIYEDVPTVYTYGPAVIAAYIFNGVFLVGSLVISSIPSKILSSRQRNAVRTWMIAWVLAAIIQFFFPEILLVSFASAFGLLVLFCAMEDPESNLDKDIYSFNFAAFREYVSMRYSFDNEFSLLAIGVSSVSNKLLEDMQEMLLLRDISKYLRNLSKNRVFYQSGNVFYIVFDNYDDLEKLLIQIKSRFNDKWDSHMGKEDIAILPTFLILPSNKIFNNEVEFTSLIGKAMFDARSSGTQETVIGEETIKHFKDEEFMRTEIRNALLEDRVEAFYQPIYSLKEKKFTAAEALVRIRRTDGSLIPPGLFIPIAEKSGFIQQIDEAVFDKTCKMIKETEVTDLGLSYVELNMSVAQSEDPSFAEKYLAIMSKYDTPPSCINLEITESARIRKKDNLYNNMWKLLRKGIKFSLDDFGTGESNLNYFVEMPVSLVKFDLSMTQSYFENEKTQIVMEKCIQMIDQMGLSTVLEGVETKEQLDILSKLDVTYIQGYYFSKPLPQSEFIQFLRENN